MSSRVRKKQEARSSKSEGAGSCSANKAAFDQLLGGKVNTCQQVSVAIGITKLRAMLKLLMKQMLKLLMKRHPGMWYTFSENSRNSAGKIGTPVLRKLMGKWVSDGHPRTPASTLRLG